MKVVFAARNLFPTVCTLLQQQINAWIATVKSCLHETKTILKLPNIFEIKLKLYGSKSYTEKC